MISLAVRFLKSKTLSSISFSSSFNGTVFIAGADNRTDFFFCYGLFRAVRIQLQQGKQPGRQLLDQKNQWRQNPDHNINDRGVCQSKFYIVDRSKGLGSDLAEEEYQEC